MLSQSVGDYEEQSDRAEQEAKKKRIDLAEAEWMQVTMISWLSTVAESPHVRHYTQSVCHKLGK